MIINKTIVPETIGDGVGQLIYKDGKLVSYEHGSTVNVYLFHEQDGEQVRALELTMSIPMTYDKCMNAAEMAVYGLQTAMDVASFNAGLARKERSGNMADILEHDNFMESVKVELEKLGISESVYNELESSKKQKVKELLAYDSSDAVNGFSYNGVNMWLDKATRAGLLLRITAEKEAGESNTTLWFGTMSFTIPIDNAFQMLYSIERYASQCYDRTAEHEAAILAKTTVSEVTEYDFTTGYPPKLSFGL